MFVSFDSVFESSALETPEGRTRGRISRATTRHPSTHRSNPRRRTACCRRRGHLGRAPRAFAGLHRVQRETNDTDVTRLLVSCQMKTVIPGLHASPPEPVPFGPSLEIRAFLLEREQGNVLVYRAETLKGRDAEGRGGGGQRARRHHPPVSEPPPRGRTCLRLGRGDVRRSALLPCG